MFLAIASGCQEEYFVELKDVPTALVVEGAINNIQGPYRIRLTYAARFQEAEAPIPVENAIVHVHISDFTAYTLHHSFNGFYNMPPHFRGEVGKSYSLEIHIPSEEGVKIYKTDPQIMPQPLQIDSVYSELGKELFFFHDTRINYVYQRYLPGSNAIITATDQNGGPSHFRFETSLYMQFTRRYEGDDPSYDYCWVRRAVTDYAGSDINQHPYQRNIGTRIAFVPGEEINLRYIGFPIEGYDRNRIIISKLYTLNEESYRYHKAKNDQLSDAGRFFDPIATQLPGNIKCVTHPEEIVLGFFEVATVSIHTFSLRTSLFYNQTEIFPIEANLMDIPPSGCIKDAFPPFWVEY